MCGCAGGEGVGVEGMKGVGVEGVKGMCVERRVEGVCVSGNGGIYVRKVYEGGVHCDDHDMHTLSHLA